MKKIRLDKYVAVCNGLTRREARLIIKQGGTTVDGQIIKDPGYSVDPQNTEVSLDGQRLIYRKHIYLLMNKPAGVISATTDNIHTTVLDLLPKYYRSFRPFPVGRLDKDTEGLLILSNDGRLAHQLLSPKKRVPKTYFAIIDGMVDHRDAIAFQKGIKLEEGIITLPSKLVILESGRISKVTVTVYEGKYHQIKRMFESTGKRVSYLKRIAMGGLALDERLKPGEVRELTRHELTLLQKTVK